MPKYKACALKPRLLDAYVGYLRQRIQSYPGLSVQRLLREIRPAREPHFERRFETAAGEQAQVNS